MLGSLNQTRLGVLGATKPKLCAQFHYDAAHRGYTPLGATFGKFTMTPVYDHHNKRSAFLAYMRRGTASPKDAQYFGKLGCIAYEDTFNLIFGKKNKTFIEKTYLPNLYSEPNHLNSSDNVIFLINMFDPLEKQLQEQVKRQQSYLYDLESVSILNESPFPIAMMNSYVAGGEDYEIRRIKTEKLKRDLLKWSWLGLRSFFMKKIYFELFCGISYPFFKNSELTSRHYYIEYLSVFAKYRGRGLGRKLLGEAENIAKVQGCTEVVLDVPVRNVDAINSYISFKFKPIEEKGGIMRMKKSLI